MSRCVPFPPTGYVWNGVSGEALIELIKVRRESAEAEKRRKKEKRKRLKMEEGMEGEIIKECNERSDNQSGKEHKFLGIDRSCLAEELKQPLISDHSYWSFDNSQIAKRKRPGSIVRIDIQLQKHEDQEVRFRKPFCSITTVDFVVQEKYDDSRNEEQSCCSHKEYNFVTEQLFSTCGESTTAALEISRPRQVLCHSRPQNELIRDGKAENAFISIYSEIEMLHIESTFRELIVNWNPPPMKIEHPDLENLDWLFKPRTERLPRSEFAEISNARNHIFSHPSSALCPTAQFLAQADTYALPFTVPF